MGPSISDWQCIIAAILLVQALLIIGLLFSSAKRRRALIKAEEQQHTLRESGERFRTTVETAPAMIWMVGPDKLCTYVNQRWLDFTGRTAAQELGTGWTESIHPDDYERALNEYESSLEAKERFECEYRMRRHNGEYRWILDTGVPRFGDSGEFLGYIGSCVDITERK